MTLRIKAHLPVSADLSAIWQDLSKIGSVHLGGENAQYVLYFTGTKEDGMTVINRILQVAGISIGITYSEGSDFYDY